jgi:hypothetical protein
MDKIQYVKNEKYLSVKGEPVEFLGLNKKGNEMVLRHLATGNNVGAPLTYKLIPFDPEKINRMASLLMKSSGPGKSTLPGKPKLSNKIDEQLKKNSLTIDQIAEMLKDAVEAQGKNLKANIHARLVSYKRRGDAVTKIGDGIYRVVFKAAGTR